MQPFLCLLTKSTAGPINGMANVAFEYKTATVPILKIPLD